MDAAHWFLLGWLLFIIALVAMTDAWPLLFIGVPIVAWVLAMLRELATMPEDDR